jgi:hypothetical protein
LINSESGGLIFINSTDQVASLTQTGSGMLTITEGGSLTVAGQSNLQGTLDVASTGTFTANGPTTATSLLLTGGTLAGTGTLNVTGSATVQGGQMAGTGTTITQAALSIVGNLTLAGGRTFQADGVTNWTNSGPGTSSSIVGDSTSSFVNRGTFNVTSDDGVTGLSVDSSFTNAGNVVISSGTTLSIVGSTTQPGSFSGNGSLIFIDGSVVLTPNSSVAVGSLTFENVTATLGGTIRVGSGDRLAIESDQRTIAVTGSITGAGNVLVNGGTVSVGASSTFAVTGTTTLNSGAVSFAGPATLGTLDVAAGDLSIAAGAIVQVSGDLALQPTSELDIEVGPSGNGLLNVGGNLTLDGTLNVIQLAGFAPTVGQSFEFLTFGTDTGSFTTMEGTTISTDEALMLDTSDSNDLRLAVVSTAPAASSARSTLKTQASAIA